VEIDYLANRRELIPEITDLLYGQWTDLFQAGGTSKDRLGELLMERAVTDRLPITLVALSDSELVGTGSIKLSEPGTKVGLSPWLAGMYVKEAHRGSGVGAAIVRALEATATEFGVKTLYLSVGAAEGFYSRLGWTVLEHANSYGVKDVALMARDLALASGAGPNNSFKPKPLRGSA
jgi:predicted N-acetyltransferase YhbS